MEPDHLRDDLKCEVLAVVCEWPEEKIINLHRDKALEFYVVRVILNQVKSKTSPFVKKYRRVKEEYIEYDVSTIYKSENSRYRHNLSISNRINNKASDEELENRQIQEQLEEIALSEIDRLYWYDAEMVRLYLKHGNFRAIEKETGIPFISCYKNIKKSLALLKAKAIEKATPLFSKEELRFIQNNK